MASERAWWVNLLGLIYLCSRPLDRCQSPPTRFSSTEPSGLDSGSLRITPQSAAFQMICIFRTFSYPWLWTQYSYVDDVEIGMAAYSKKLADVSKRPYSIQVKA